MYKRQHYLTQVYEEQDGTLEGTTAFLDGLKAGTEDLKSNARWNSLMDTFDVLMKYNMNAGDPLAADYNNNAVSLAEGDIAFWFNGNWAWAVSYTHLDVYKRQVICPLLISSPPKISSP